MTSCELVERIVHARRSNEAGEAKLRKTPTGELRPEVSPNANPSSNPNPWPEP